jgi:hypothetical protein
MHYCLMNKIKTPDGTILWCKSAHDYQQYVDKNGETYISDGLGWMVRRSVNKEPYTDFSVWVNADNLVLTEEVRSTPFWKSYGKEGEHYPDGVVLALQQMEDDHIRAIIETQRHIQGSVVEKLMKLEADYRGLF